MYRKIGDCLHDKLTKDLVCKKCKEKFFVKQCPCSIKDCKNKSILVVDKNENIANVIFLDQPVCRYHEKEVLKKHKETEEWIVNNQDEFYEIIETLFKNEVDKWKH